MRTLLIHGSISSLLRILISNLCSLEKVFEKLILKEIENSGVSDGNHQHGYKANHSTTTAMLTLQDFISENVDQGKSVMVYSLDLSAAFDMLRADIFLEKIGKKFAPWLQNVILDFLSHRKCVVKIEDSISTERDVPCGCVQGSVLGP